LSIFADPGKGGSAFYNYSSCITYNYTPEYLPNSSELNGYCSAPFGTKVQITAKPAIGYLFKGWVGSGAGSYTGTNYNATIMLNANITETANFQISTVNSKASVINSSNNTKAYASISTAISSLTVQLPNENIHITNVTAESNGNVTTYIVQTQVNAKILFLFPVHYYATVSVNESSGKIESIQKPWWTFFTTK
jgi:uncharacterized repeat protein (TIGR02543 family)